MDSLRNQRRRQIQIVSTLKMRLSDIETKVTEDIKQLELEHSLLAGEYEAESEKLKKVIKTKMLEL